MTKFNNTCHGKSSIESFRYHLRCCETDWFWRKSECMTFMFKYNPTHIKDGMWWSHSCHKSRLCLLGTEPNLTWLISNISLPPAVTNTFISLHLIGDISTEFWIKYQHFTVKNEIHVGKRGGKKKSLVGVTLTGQCLLSLNFLTWKLDLTHFMNWMSAHQPLI